MPLLRLPSQISKRFILRSNVIQYQANIIVTGIEDRFLAGIHGLEHQNEVAAIWNNWVVGDRSAQNLSQILMAW